MARNVILMSFIFYLASVSAISDTETSDIRFPLDSSIIKGVLDDSNSLYVQYYYNETDKVLDYRVFIEAHTYGFSRSCGYYQLKINEKSTFSNDFRIVSLGKYSALLLPFEYRRDTNSDELARIEVVDASSCLRTEIVLPTENKPKDVRVTAYTDSFDIYFKDSSLCGNKVCRKSYDFEGKPITTSFAEFDNSTLYLPLVKPIGTEKRSNDHVAFTFPQKKVISHIIKNNELKTLKEVEADFVFGAGHKMLTPEVSFTHEATSIVSRWQYTNLNLIQLDSEGNVKFDVIVKYGFFVRTAKVLNAPEGGAYLLGSECEREHCHEPENRYIIKKIDANGNEVGSLALTLPQPGVLDDLSFYESDGSYCLSRLQLSLAVAANYYFKSFDTNTKCFTDEDF